MEYFSDDKKDDMRAFINEVILALCEEPIQYSTDDKVHNRYDKGYKYLLSVKRNFIDLVKEFTKIEWDEEIKEEDINLMDKEFITSEYLKRESDLIYEVRKGKKVVYFVLLELQSKTDRKMAYRILNYEVEIWRKYEKNLKKGEKFELPPIIPCVLYNGKSKWTSPLEFNGLYSNRNVPEEYLLNLKYILIDVRKYKPEELLELKNVIGSAFYLDSAKQEDLAKRLERIIKNLENLDKESKKVFKNWVLNILRLKDISKEKIEEKFISEEDEELGGIQTELEEWYKRTKKEERREGAKFVLENILKSKDISKEKTGGKFINEEDEELGEIKAEVETWYERSKEEERQEGIKLVLKDILTRKLKEEPDKEILEKMDKATMEQVERLNEKFFDITSWKEVAEILG